MQTKETTVMWIEINTTAILFLTVGSILLGAPAHKRGLNPWVWGGDFIRRIISGAVASAGGLISLVIGCGVIAGVIYMSVTIDSGHQHRGEGTSFRRRAFG